MKPHRVAHGEGPKGSRSSTYSLRSSTGKSATRYSMSPGGASDSRVRSTSPAYGKRPKSINKKINTLNATLSFICIKYERQIDEHAKRIPYNSKLAESKSDYSV